MTVIIVLYLWLIYMPSITVLELLEGEFVLYMIEEEKKHDNK